MAAFPLHFLAPLIFLSLSFYQFSFLFMHTYTYTQARSSTFMLVRIMFLHSNGNLHILVYVCVHFFVRRPTLLACYFLICFTALVYHCYCNEIADFDFSVFSHFPLYSSIVFFLFVHRIFDFTTQLYRFARTF